MVGASGQSVLGRLSLNCVVSGSGLLASNRSGIFCSYSPVQFVDPAMQNGLWRVSLLLLSMSRSYSGASSCTVSLFECCYADTCSAVEFGFEAL